MDRYRAGPPKPRQDSVSAVIISDYAMDHHESQALALLRNFPSAKKQLALQLLDVLARSWFSLWPGADIVVARTAVPRPESMKNGRLRGIRAS